jgi:hypothetical protein
VGLSISTGVADMSESLGLSRGAGGGNGAVCVSPSGDTWVTWGMEGCSGRESVILAAPIGAADVGDSPGLSREGGDDDNRSIVCAALSAALDAAVGPSDEFPLSVEGRSKARTVWASS